MAETSLQHCSHYCTRCSYYEGSVLVRKLGFPKRLMGIDADQFSRCVVLTLCSEVDLLLLVRKCNELEESLGTGITGMMIAGRKECCLREMIR